MAPEPIEQRCEPKSIRSSECWIFLPLGKVVPSLHDRASRSKKAMNPGAVSLSHPHDPFVEVVVGAVPADEACGAVMR